MVYGAALERRLGRKVLEGSNPSLSAIFQRRLRWNNITYDRISSYHWSVWRIYNNPPNYHSLFISF